MIQPQSSARPIRRVLGLFWSFSRGQRRWLLRGSIAALFVVGARLALPFPLRNLARHVAEPEAAGGAGATATAGTVDPFLAVGGALLGLFVVLGLADLCLRVWFARYAISTVREARTTAIRSIREHSAAYRGLRSGELVARLIGDTARAKAGIKAFLIHVFTNSVLLIGVSVVLCFKNPSLALIFLAAFLLVAGLTWICARASHRVAHRYREKEGKLANRVEKAWSDEYGDKSVARLNRTSGDAEAGLTRLEGLCGWGAHGALGLAILAAVLVGKQEIAAGDLAGSDLLLFLIYAVLLRAPLVKIVSQGASSGKILACAERIAALCEAPAQVRPVLAPLESRIRFEAVKVSTKKVNGLRRRRIGPIDLEIRAGEKVALVGPASSGKTTLLRTLAGLETVRRGRVLWDEQDLTKKRALDRSGVIHFVPDSPSWHRTALRRLLHVDRSGPLAPTPKKELKSLLGKFGAMRPLKRHCADWSTPISSADFSIAESKAIALARALRSEGSLLLLDEPFGSMTEKQRAAAVQAIGKWRGAVIVALRADSPERTAFDRVIGLEKGRVAGGVAPAPAAIAPPRPPTLPLELPHE